MQIDAECTPMRVLCESEGGVPLCVFRFLDYQYGRILPSYQSMYIFV